jgi:membrane protease YdiL (CAAX protease family)
METLSAPPKKSTLLIGILLLLAILFAFVVFAGKALALIYGVKEINASMLFISRILFWTSLLFIFIYARKVEKQKILIWEERKYQFWQYLVSVIAIFFALIIALLIVGGICFKLGLQKESEKFLQMLAIFKHNPFLIFLTAATAGVVEELTFRGYLLPRMAILFKSPVIAIIVSSLLFGFLHFSYGTLFQVIGTFVIGLIFAIYYYKFRNITVLIITHFLWDTMAIYLQFLAEYLKHGK